MPADTSWIVPLRKMPGVPRTPLRLPRHWGRLYDQRWVWLALPKRRPALRAGESLSAVTQHLSARLGVRHRMLPMSEEALKLLERANAEGAHANAVAETRALILKRLGR